MKELKIFWVGFTVDACLSFSTSSINVQCWTMLIKIPRVCKIVIREKWKNHFGGYLAFYLHKIAKTWFMSMAMTWWWNIIDIVELHYLFKATREVLNKDHGSSIVFTVIQQSCCIAFNLIIQQYINSGVETPYREL